ncbi:MAG TPA: ABC transporter ATP-binding protein [Steroidobacteraceae bacterium]|jgi:ABC-2 type transport system ATP-binding protein|nr:ABC transporter ATP-binding protein [Steroidobacteraceae bacterium]
MTGAVPISFACVSYSFGRRLALTGIDLALPAGRRHGLAGPNGSGKTTLLRLMAGLLAPTAGTVNCLGFESPSGHGAFKEHVAYVTQEFSLYEELTVEENLSFVADLYSLPEPIPASRRAQTVFDLTAYSRQRAGAVSVGVRQRLMLAAAFMRDPQLLLLDEPTAALDEESSDVLWRHIDAAQSTGATIVLTTHRERDLARCDSVTQLVAGRIVGFQVTSRP